MDDEKNNNINDNNNNTYNCNKGMDGGGAREMDEEQEGEWQGLASVCFHLRCVVCIGKC